MTLLPIITRSRQRRRSIALSVDPDGSVRVQAPMRLSMKWIEAFIAQKESWIKKRQQEIAARQAIHQESLKEGATILFLGRPLRLVLSQKEEGQKENELHLSLSLPSTSPDYTKEIELALRLWYKKQARHYIPERASFWATQTNLIPARVIITAPQKRWGSCSAENIIRLNWRLIMISPKIIDYVIVHELAHIHHKNHGPAFWRCVEKTIPDYKQRRKELRSWEENPARNPCF